MVTVDGAQKRLAIPSRDDRGTIEFGFDRVFGEKATQYDVYKFVSPAVQDVARRGLNATVFAYGQTGTVRARLRLRARASLKPHSSQGRTAGLSRAGDRADAVRAPHDSSLAEGSRRFLCLRVRARARVRAGGGSGDRTHRGSRTRSSERRTSS